MRTEVILLPAALLIATACGSDSALTAANDASAGGEASAPQLLIEPARLTFDPVGVGCDGERLLRVTNAGRGTLTLDSAGVTGDAAADFGLAGPGAFDLGASESVLLTVRFTASALGARAGTLELLSNDPARPTADVPLEGDGDNGRRIRTDDFATHGRAVDVLFVIDNSGSMRPKQENVAANIADFFGWFVDLDLDFHMGVITTDIVDPTHSGRLQGAVITAETTEPEARLADAVSVGEDDMGDESGLAALELALSEPLRSGDNGAFYRDDAFLSVIILSDEPEQSGRSSAHYIEFLNGLKADPERISVSTVVGDRATGCVDSCGARDSNADPGDTYIDVQEAFPGVFASVCDCDYQPAMEALGLESTGVPAVFELTEVPADAAEIEVVVDGAATPHWAYSEADNTVEILDDGLPPGAASVYVSYPVEGPCAD